MNRNEAATRAEFVDPSLARSGWGQDSSSRINYEFQITLGRKQIGNKRSPAQIADYLLESRGQHLAIIEAKKYDAHVTEGLAQAKAYAQKMAIRFAYSTNGREIYAADLNSGREGLVDAYPTPNQLWEMTFAESNLWRDRFLEIPDERRGGLWQSRYYQDIAINKVLDEIADNKRRILLTLATGAGKTAIAFQIAWKLFQTRWNLSGEPTRRPRILFLADRNILADQAYNAFGAFPEDAMERIKPADVKKAGVVPKNASVFFTIFQTFLTESTGEVNYGQYPTDFFDFIVIDECHRGGANDESTWRAILEYFEPAVQLGLTATPRRDINIDTYKYFGEPVYSYSLKDGIEDGFLTPFRVRQFDSTIDEYMYTPDDIVLEGEVEPGRVYTESDFNRLIFIEERERLRVKLFMDEIGTNDKTLIFCANQNHALTIRDLINQHVQPKDADFCVRVTANDGATGEEFLRKFQDNDKTVPTILTTSHKLSTGVDALNVRNIVLLRPIKSMIEFKQIIGRGTRLFEGKDYFTVYDFVEAYKHFSDPDWDGEPIEPGGTDGRKATSTTPTEPKPPQQRIVIKLRDGKERAIQHMTQTMFMGPDGRPMTAQDFIKELFGTLSMPEFFSSEDELRLIWSDPVTRRALLGRLTEAGFPIDDLREVQKLIDAENSDLFDVLEYVAYAKEPVSRLERALATRPQLQSALSPGQVDFIHFVLDRYVETGFEELDDARLPELIKLKYEGIHEGVEALGGTDQARRVFIDFQRHLYATG